MKASTLLKLFIVAAALGCGFVIVRYLAQPSATVAIAGKGNVLNSVSGTITVKPAVQTKIASTEPGFLAESLLSDGAHITKGQVIAHIDPGDLPLRKRALELRLEEIQRQLNSEQPEDILLRTQRDELEDARELFDKKQMPKAEFDRKENEYLAAVAQVEQSDAKLKNEMELVKNDIAQLDYRLSRLDIRSPLDGTVTVVHAFPGDLLHQGTPIATITSDAVKIEAEVNQDDVASVRNANRALVRFFAYGNRVFAAQVDQLLPSTDAATQRFTVFLSLLEEPPEILPGLTGEVSFIAGERRDTLVIPRRALLNDRVMLVEDGTVRTQEVTPGYVSMTKAEIITGLVPGDEVIVEDQDLFREGDRVRVKRKIE